MADQDTGSIHYFYKGWSLTKEGELSREDAGKIAQTGMLWRSSLTCRPIAVSQSTLDSPTPSRLDLSLSRDFIRAKK
jgi:hypothetical protein